MNDSPIKIHEIEQKDLFDGLFDAK